MSAPGFQFFNTAASASCGSSLEISYVIAMVRFWLKNNNCNYHIQTLKSLLSFSRISLSDQTSFGKNKMVNSKQIIASNGFHWRYLVMPCRFINSRPTTNSYIILFAYHQDNRWHRKEIFHASLFQHSKSFMQKCFFFLKRHWLYVFPTQTRKNSSSHFSFIT